MTKIIPAVAMLLLVFGCANNSSSPSYSSQANYNSHLSDYPGRKPHAGEWAVAAVGTPFFLAFKTAVCGASLVVAAPAAAAIALTDSPYGMTVSELGDGVAVNCGPPYVLSPN